ncbi:hypothetical protein AVEN_240256-1 [Araneus ventricosus]|uniref:Uncharacterized protein n=1 Tax=Araneus ventricosus TaxID=182803 RepID=A0A4Y2PMI9_ARAVE|nr:hypothetical protein AVEN_240256-1 [Araneus ventricosus]
MESSSTFKLISSPNRDIEKIPASLRSHISSPSSGVQTLVLSLSCSLAHGRTDGLSVKLCSLENPGSFDVLTCGLWSVEFRAVVWLGKSLGSARVNGCIDAVWPLPSFDVRAIYRHNARNNRCTYKPTSHIDSSCSDGGE